MNKSFTRSLSFLTLLLATGQLPAATVANSSFESYTLVSNAAQATSNHGFGSWQAAVATVLGLVAKEEVVGVFGSLSSMADADLAFELVEAADAAGLNVIGQEFFGGSKLAAFSFMIFNLLCAPCFAAMGAIKREMNNGKWTAFAITYMCVFAYVISLIVYHFGLVFTGVFSIWTIVAVALFAALTYLTVRKNPYQ